MNYKYFFYIVLPIMILGLAGVGLLVYTHAYIWLLSTFVFWVLLSGFGIATGFHRIYSHQCYEPNKILDFFLLLCGTLACQSSSLTWVAIHIGYHHRYSDGLRDLHTPTKGIWHAFLGWTFLINEKTVNHKYAIKLMKKSIHIYFHKHYFKIVWSFIIALFLIGGWKITLIGYSIAAMISILQDNLVNVLGHIPSLGYRNYETADKSSNFPFLGYFGWGQGWHNNHHKFPDRFNFGIKWWEFDPCRLFKPILELGNIRKE